MNISVEELFKKSYVLSIDATRLNTFYKLLKSENVNILPKCYEGFTNQDLEGVYKCSLGHVSMIRMAKANNLPFILLMEDDAYPIDGLVNKLNLYLKDIPDDTYILKLGWFYNYDISKLNEKFSISRGNTWGTHSFIVFQRAYNAFLKEYDANTKLPADHFFLKLSNSGKRVLLTNENLFIQYTDKKSMNSYVGYMYDGVCNKKPPSGYSSVDKKLEIENRKINRNIVSTAELKNDIVSLGNFAYRINGGNIGDFVIAASEYQLFDSLGLNYKTISRVNKESTTSKPFNLVYGGGGGWVKYYNFDDPVYSILKSSNLKKCVFMPSSFYECDKFVKDVLDERFTVYCRDYKSYDYCTSINCRANFKLHDDIALSLNLAKIDYSYLPMNSNREEIVNACRKIKEFIENNNGKTASFIRNDAEKTIECPDSNIDISSLFNSFGEDIGKDDSIDVAKIMLYTISKFDVIKTNRLHVALMSCLLDKKLEIWNNSYGKLKNVYEMSLKGRFNHITTHFDDVKKTQMVEAVKQQNTEYKRPFL